MVDNRLGGNPSRRKEALTEPEDTVPQELLQEYMLKAPRQVRVGVAS